MNEWIDDFAAELGEAPISQGEMGALLKLARVVAHEGGDRRLAPLSTYLAGVHAGRAADRRQAVDEAVAAARRSLPADREPQARENRK